MKKAKQHKVNMYTVDVTNIRKTPKIKKNNIVRTIGWGTKLHGYKWEGWFYTKKGCIKLSCLSKKQPKYRTVYAPYVKHTKSYMPLCSITNRATKQYALRVNYAYTGKYGIAMAKNRYLVAMASYFNLSIGQYFDLVLADGTVIPCIMGDAKANRHTDSATHSYTVATQCMSEFIIGSVSTLKRYLHGSGSLSAIKEFSSPVKMVRIYNKTLF